MRYLALPILVFAAVIAGCAGTAPAPAHAGLKAGETATGSKDAFKVIIDNRVSEEEQPLWQAYGIARANLWRERPASTKNNSGDDFAIELGARETALTVYRELGARVAYFDFLAEVQKLGFLDEYVLVAFGKPGWTIPGNALAQIDRDGFMVWARAHLEKHEAQTRAATIPSNGIQWPEVPGSAMIDTIRPLFSDEQAPCGELEVLKTFVSDWKKQAAKLDGRAVAADSPLELLSALATLKNDPNAIATGVTWVPYLVYKAHFYAGFCAVEKRDYVHAEEPLQTAVSLAPNYSNARIELAYIYIHEKKFQLAETEIFNALRLTNNPCVIAGGLRKVGFIRFEQGRWADAIAAYRESLRYEPNNAVALSEIKLLEQASRSGSDPSQGAAGAGFIIGKQIVSVCTPNPTSAKPARDYRQSERKTDQASPPTK